MKYNQYAYVEENPSKQIEELLNINFLPKNYQSWSFSDLLAKLIETIIVEAKTDEAKKAKLSEFAVSKDGGEGEPIDAISGATITSRAVTGAVNAALAYFQNAF